MKSFCFYPLFICFWLYLPFNASAQIFTLSKNKKPINLSGVYEGHWTDLNNNKGEIKMKIYSMKNSTEYGGFFISTDATGQIHTGAVEFQRENNFLKGYFNPTVYERYDSTRSVFNCYLGIHGVFKKDDSDNVVIEGEAVGGSCEENNLLFLYIKMEEPVLEEFITAQ